MARLVLFGCFAAALFWGARACEVVLTHSEIAAGKLRAIEFSGSGASTHSQLGWAVNAAGDLNCDGFGDFALAAPKEVNYAGAVYVVFGRNATEWAGAAFDFGLVDTPDAASWIRISGEKEGAQGMFLGMHGVAHGDFNGDGLSDLFLGVSYDVSAVVVFGHCGAWTSFETTQIGDTVDGFSISGGGGMDKYVGNAGDMNGDGIEDLLVGIGTNPSSSYIVFGKAGMDRAPFNLSDITGGANGFRIGDGSASIGLQCAMGSAGDVNGDGLNDLVIGSHTVNTAYVLFAQNTSATGQDWQSLNLAQDLNGANGFAIEYPASSKLGWTAVGAGDVNADGFADVFVGSNSESLEGAWIVFGHPAPWTPSFSVSELNGTNGFHFATTTGEYWGFSGGAAGDVNGDSIDDIIIGGFRAAQGISSNVGMGAVIFGHSGAWPAEIDRSSVVGSVGFTIEGPSYGSYFGYSARGAGDINGDGLADVVLGAHFHGLGYAALVFGMDDHCKVCSNTTEECLLCNDGFSLIASPEGAFCTTESALSSSSTTSNALGSGSISSVGSKSVTSSTTGASTVVVIETGGGGNAVAVAEEVAQLLGVDVGQISVVEITSGTFEVTVINEEVAQQLVTLIEQCIEDQQ